MALDRLPPGIALGYLDDILVMGKTVKEHLINLRRVLELHSQVGLKLNLKKCDICTSDVEYLGHRVTDQGIRMLDSYIERIENWPVPETGKDVQKFLGFAGYYRSFIPDYTTLTAGLNKLKSTSGRITLSETDLNN